MIDFTYLEKGYCYVCELKTLFRFYSSFVSFWLFDSGKILIHFSSSNIKKNLLFINIIIILNTVKPVYKRLNLLPTQHNLIRQVVSEKREVKYK